MKYDVLPTVSLEELDESAFAALMLDLALRGHDCDVTVKTAACMQGGAAPSASLAAAGYALARGHVAAIQVRYQYNGARWVDTILKTADAFKLVRMESHFDAR